MSSISKNLFQTPIQISKSQLGLLNVDLVKLAYKLKEENNFVETTEQKVFKVLFIITKIFYNKSIYTFTNK